MSEIPELTSTAIERMFCSEMVQGTIILQVLHSITVKHRGLRCCSVVLSDGLHMTSCFMVKKVPSKFARPKKFTVIKVNHYYRSVIETANECTEVFIEIDSFTKLTSQLPIQHSIGDPKQFDTSSIIKEHVFLRTKFLAEKAALTNGALARIMAGECVEKPTVQIMSANLCSYERGEKRLDMSVCDGLKVEKISCAQPLLVQQLSQHLPYLKLSIVQLDKFEFAAGCIVIDEITWLNWGSHVCFNLAILRQRATLSEGSIHECVKYGRWVREPIVQIVKIKDVHSHSERKRRKLLVISDGRFYTNAYLSTQLEQSQRGLLTKRCIVRLDVYKSNYMRNDTVHKIPFKCSSITVCGLTLLNQAPTVDLQWHLRTARPTLTDNGIDRIFNSSGLISPVVRIVQVNMILNGVTDESYIRLLIYDGTKTCRAYLPSHMNYLEVRLEELPIVSLDCYLTEFKATRHERLLTVSQLTLLYLPNEHDE